jgi:hypothetical protein
VTQPTADIGPIEEAAALTALIEQRRAELADLIGRRTRKLEQARATSTATVAAIARRVRLSPGRISQVTKRGAAMSGVAAAGRARRDVQTAAPTALPATEVAPA